VGGRKAGGCFVEKKTMSLRLYLQTYERLRRAKHDLEKKTFDETVTALLDALPDQGARGEVGPVEEKEEEEGRRREPNLRLHRDTHRRLRRVKHELEKESFNEAIQALLDEHYGLGPSSREEGDEGD